MAQAPRLILLQCVESSYLRRFFYRPGESHFTGFLLINKVDAGYQAREDTDNTYGYEDRYIGETRKGGA